MLRRGIPPVAAGLIVVFGGVATAAGWLDWSAVGGWLQPRIGWLVFGVAGVLLVTAVARAVRHGPDRKTTSTLGWWVIAAAVVVASVGWGATTWLLREADRASDPAAARLEAIKIGCPLAREPVAYSRCCWRCGGSSTKSTIRGPSNEMPQRSGSPSYTPGPPTNSVPTRPRCGWPACTPWNGSRRTTPEQRQTIVNVLCAYLRMPYQHPNDPPAADADEQMVASHEERVQEREVRRAAQRVLRDHLRPGPHRKADSAFWMDISLDLTGAILIDFDLAECVVYTARFAEASFIGRTNFKSATFQFYANFSSVTFTSPTTFMAANFVIEADFSSAIFDDWSSFESAYFATVDFESAKFNNTTTFRSATFFGPRYSPGTFPYTDFTSATFARGVPAELAPFVEPPTTAKE